MTSRLFGGAAAVAIGLAVSGAGTIAMVAMVARYLSPLNYASFVTWWATATLLATTFGVFEVFLTRLVIADIVAGRSPRHSIGIIVGRAWMVAAAIAALSIALAPALARSLFHGNLEAALLLAVFVMIAATQSLQRGAATGHRRFKAVAGQLATDGVVRAAGVAVLLVSGQRSVSLLVLATCLSSASSLIVGDRLCPEWRARPLLRSRLVSWRPAAFLLAGAVSPVLIYNGAVPWLSATHSVSAKTLGAFAGAMTLSRLPTQLGSAAFGPVLSYLANAIEMNDGKGFRRTRLLSESLCLGVGVVFVLGFTLLGHRILAAYLGPTYQLAANKMALLSAASAVMLIAIVQQAALAARHRWSAIGMSWLMSTVAFVAVLFLPFGALLRASLAPLAAVGVAYCLMAVRTRRFEAALVSNGTQEKVTALKRLGEAG